MYFFTVSLCIPSSRAIPRIDSPLRFAFCTAFHLGRLQRCGLPRARSNGPRFNGRFKVPAQESEVAYRAVDGGMCLERVLCFKYRRRVARDNTVRYRWRTLQLLPDTDRPTYAGAAVEVLEGRIIPSQEAPPRPNILRNFTERTAHTPAPHIDSNGLGRYWAEKLARLDVEVPHNTAGSNGAGRVRKKEALQHAVRIVEGGRARKAQFGYEPVLERSRGAFHTPLGLRRLSEYQLYPKLVHRATELGGSSGSLR